MHTHVVAGSVSSKPQALLQEDQLHARDLHYLRLPGIVVAELGKYMTVASSRYRFAAAISRVKIYWRQAPRHEGELPALLAEQGALGSRSRILPAKKRCRTRAHDFGVDLLNKTPAK